MTTFNLSDVQRGELYDSLDVEASVRSLLVKPVEAMSCAAQRLVSCDTQHTFVKAAHDAFYDHHPLVIRPDDIWFCIAQGFATHVGENQESLRARFVAHEGKVKLSVNRPDFFLGQPNPWPEAFAAFSKQIGDQVGTVHDVISAHFSTTTPTETAAYDICLMDTFQGYFEYEMRCGCGIPEITLLGTPDDWASMIPRVQQFAQYGLETWTSALVPILEKIVSTARGDIDTAFWVSFFRYQSGSGPSELTGWMLALFPYLIVDHDKKTLAHNPFLSSWSERFDIANSRGSQRITDAVQGPGMGAIPGSLVSAPVKYTDLSVDKTHSLRFVAGMFGVEQHAATRALAASFGWAIVYD